jgi:rhodanese-related sulfurtransferase
VAGVRQLDVETLRDWRTRQTPHVLLDVREADEVQTASVDGATWIPMGDVPERIEEIPSDVPVVVMCHHGSRSSKVAHYLAGTGRSDIYNLTGGIDAYAERVDPALARY